MSICVTCGHPERHHVNPFALTTACLYPSCPCKEFVGAPAYPALEQAFGGPVEAARDYICPRLWKGAPCAQRVELGRNCDAQHDPSPPVKCAEVTKDSGERKSFSTGSQRDAPAGKGAYHLISPLALRRLALVLERGAAKYEARNWELGQPLSQYVNSATRHIMQFVAGYRDEDHAGQAFWNLMALVHTEEEIASGRLPAELHDLPDYTKETK